MPEWGIFYPRCTLCGWRMMRIKGYWICPKCDRPPKEGEENTYAPEG